jgi:hypothetical protein
LEEDVSIMGTDVFEWQVAEAYTWVPTRVDAGGGATREQWVLGEVCSGRPFPAARSYHPLLEFSGLFLVFGDTEPTLDGIRQFAARFGPLLRPGQCGPATTAKDQQGRTVRLLTGEPLELWQLQISALAHACGLWHALQLGDADGLAAHVLRRKDAAGRDEVYYASHPGLEDGAVTPSGHVAAEEVIASPTFHPERLARPGDLAVPALAYIQAKINARLAGQVSPRLVWDAERNRSTLRLVPDSLLGALWLEFGEAVAGDKGFRRCDQCDLWFELGVPGGRRSRLFCSGACRTRSHRARREKALEFHRQGKGAKEIAKATATGLTTVRKWLKQAKS